MRRMFFASMLVCVMCSGSYALSEDMNVYVRQDVFDVKMEMLFTRLEGKIDALSERIDNVEKSLSEKIDGVDKKLSAQIDGVDKKLSAQIDGMDKKIDSVEKSLSEKFDGADKKLSVQIDGVDKKLSAQFDGLDKRIENTHTFVYWILVLFGAIFLMPFVSRFWELHRERNKSALTVEDIQRIVREIMSENDTKLRG